MRAALKSPHFVIGRIGNPLSWDRWPEARALLLPAIERSDENPEAVEAGLADEKLQLWCVLEGEAMRAATVTHIANTKRGEVVEVYLVGGAGMEAWIAPLNDEIEAQSREIGCVALRAYGRKGWRDPLAELGWKSTAVIYEKAL